ncbi:VOC family protein [Ferroacidibacillus organovorans]|uniref:Glyoxalase n=1 Tax=Ferroacidibacillus organovorans TaxID=1765683 RepID=A0A853KCC2_9BACL|nr:VOC family protein [Ferroacidibacillus organovorans]KYP79453.1 glyoxalase [Ferroacidibacillus organovorans]OAG94507.1 glyoxalase [Ferroacidibacillus organovorans]
MKILFVAGFGSIVRDELVNDTSRFYQGVLGIDFERVGDYVHTGNLDGVKHFALWPLSQAAESCFGTPHWPSDVPEPRTWIEMDVDDVAEATKELVALGYHCLVSNREEPWGQTVTRLISPDGALMGLTRTPWMRNDGR